MYLITSLANNYTSLHRIYVKYLQPLVLSLVAKAIGRYKVKNGN